MRVSTGRGAWLVGETATERLQAKVVKANRAMSRIIFFMVGFPFMLNHSQPAQKTPPSNGGVLACPGGQELFFTESPWFLPECIIGRGEL
jgi:hypothetical protein